MKPSKFIQLIAAPYDDNFSLYALDDYGVVWYRHDEYWYKLSMKRSEEED